jgi:NitT/TauT family transport system substrate-binding protein
MVDRRPSAVTPTFRRHTLSLPGLTGQSSTPWPVDETHAVPHQKHRGYWIARSSRAMTCVGYKCWDQTTSVLSRGAAVAALAAAMALTSVAHAEELIPVRLRLDWVWQAPQAIWTLANERGYFRDEGLSVTIDRGYGGVENAAALAAGNYDIMFSDINSVILFDAQNLEHKLVTVLVIYDAYPGAVITRKGNGIAKPKDIEGKTIGAPVTQGARTMFPAFAHANGIDESKINWQTVSIQLQDQQFVQGQFDAIASFATTALLNLKQLGMGRDKLTVFNFADHGVDLFGSGLAVRADFVQNKPHVIEKFIRATYRGMKAMLANKVEAIESLRKRDPLLSIPIEVERLDLMIDMTLRRPSVEANGVGYVDPARMQRSIDSIAAAFKISNPPKPAEVYTGRFVPPQAERMMKF